VVPGSIPRMIRSVGIPGRLLLVASICLIH
jgi:hypothetical protein